MSPDPTAERGAIRKDPGGKLGVALVYPNVYRLGMANLGLHAVYRILNDDPGAYCERAFLPEDLGTPRTVESGRPLSDFDVVAFSLSFEDDYPNVLALLAPAGLPLRSAARDERHPLVVAGARGGADEPGAHGALLRRIPGGGGGGAGGPLPRPVAGGGEGEGGAGGAPFSALSTLGGFYVPGLYDVAYSDTRAPGGAG